MTLFAITGLSVAIFCLILGLFILKHAENETQRIWGALNLVVAFWAFGTYLVGISTSPERAILNWRIAYVGGTFIAIVFYHLVYSFCQLNKTGLLILIYTQGLLFLPFILLTNHFANTNLTLYIFDSIYYNKATFLFSFWLGIWLIIVSSAFYKLHKFKKSLRGVKKIQAEYLFWAMILGFAGGTSSVLPSYNLAFYPVLQLSICFYVVIMTFAIFKYRLMELTIIVKRSIIYSLLITSITILYLLSVFVLEKCAQQLFGYKSLIISVGTAFGLGLIFIPLRHRIHSFVDRYFFKGTQEEIAQQNELLRREVTQSEKHKAVAALASGIAHEVRNPLTALKTFYEHFPQKKNDPEFIAKFTQIAGKEIGRIEGLIQQLLDFAKPSPPSFQETDINRLIEDTLSLLSNQLQAHKIAVHKHLASSIQHLNVDKNQIKQALLNILLNAIDAMPTGGTLTVKTTIWDQRLKTNDQRSLVTGYWPLVTITIADTGSGIAPEDLKHIFEPFFSKKASGTGLGLAITQSIIEEHKGKIKVTSTINEGTTFTIELPIKEN